MKQTNLVILIVFVLLSSCYSTRITQDFLTPENKNQGLISNLELKFDEASFSSTFSTSQRLVENELIDDDFVSSSEYQIIRDNSSTAEIRSLIKKYAKFYGNSSDNQNGSIKFGVNFYDAKTNYSYAAISVYTLGALNLLGMPTGKFSHSVEFEAAIYNASGDLVKVYRGFGTDKYITGLYYHSFSQKRSSFIKSIKNALAQIDNQIFADREFLESSLQIN